MLAANEAVARELKNRGIPTIYRVHENPDPERAGRISRVCPGPRNSGRRSDAPGRVAKTTRRDPGNRRRASAQDRAAQKSEAGTLRHDAAGSLWPRENELYPFHQPDPALC